MQNLYLCNEKNESSSLNFTLLYICILEFLMNAQKTAVSLVIKLHSVRDKRIVQTFLSDSYISTLYFSFLTTSIRAATYRLKPDISFLQPYNSTLKPLKTHPIASQRQHVPESRSR